MAGRKIIDEFTDLPVSHQRKSQLRNRKRGLCENCGKPPNVENARCFRHRKRKQPKGGQRMVKLLARREFIRLYIKRHGIPKGACRAFVELCRQRGIKTNPRTVCHDLHALGFFTT